MRLARYSDAERFLSQAQAELEAREAEHNLILGLALGLRSEAAPLEAPAFFATVRDAGGLAVAALRAPRYPLVLASPRTEATAPLQRLIEELCSSGTELGSVVAPSPLAAEFARLWSQATDRPAEVGMRQRLYSLVELQAVPALPGTLRRAQEADTELVGGWMTDFGAEAEGVADPARARQLAEQRIARGEIYLWEDPEPRSMAACARATRHGIAVNAVYTPPKWRRQGLASATVARLTELLLGRGSSFCVLFTDLDNPTSNSIYMRIGYQPVRDFTLFRFPPPDAATRGVRDGHAPCAQPGGTPVSEQDNLDAVRQVYAAFVRKDLPTILDLQADDVEWSVAGPGDRIPWAAPRSGREGVSDFLRTLARWLVAEQFEIRDYLANGDTVVALGYQRGHVPATGKTYAFDFVHVWRLRQARITSFRVYYDSAYVASLLERGPSRDDTTAPEAS